jgi:hypothetical protein
MQRRAGIEAITDVRGSTVWSPSALQPGDWGTRDGLAASLEAMRRGTGIRLWLRAPTLVLMGFEGSPLQGALHVRFDEELRKCRVRIALVDELSSAKFCVRHEAGLLRLSALLESGRGSWVGICVYVFQDLFWVGGDGGRFVSYPLGEVLSFFCDAFPSAPFSITCTMLHLLLPPIHEACQLKDFGLAELKCITVHTISTSALRGRVGTSSRSRVGSNLTSLLIAPPPVYDSGRLRTSGDRDGALSRARVLIGEHAEAGLRLVPRAPGAASVQSDALGRPEA